ncbi:LysR family transcriptional regulator [Cohnella nanjingensis]|uniref:LysR family transcriptional regulator n=1 Tax=Cohnella nanjingensis TaxID=1387779 RepID=A0A7X0RWT0_9BACL|nr:LysR family transcriptional regulator [Cohnella nanjingensis]MBB6675123.1 LysR family transcriptional regulator [Cohnella nanjingensis]
MELLQLQYFRTVARLEHMTQAAQALRIAQPALSKTIARLEEDLGVPLFDRQGRQIRLNAFGRAFLARTETALSALEEGRRELTDLAGITRGRLHIATPTLNRLSAALTAYRELYPEVSLRVTQVPTEEMVRLLESGEADFGFSSLPFNRPGIRELPVLREEVCLAVPAGHRWADRPGIALAETAGEPFIGYTEDNPFRQRDDALFRQAGMVPKYACEVSEPAAKTSLIRAGLGIGFAGACNRDRTDPPPSLSMLRISDPVCQGSFQLAWHERHYMSKAAEAFRDFLVKFIADETDSKRPLAGAG